MRKTSRVERRSVYQRVAVWSRDAKYWFERSDKAILYFVGAAVLTRWTALVLVDLVARAAGDAAPWAVYVASTLDVVTHHVTNVAELFAAAATLTGLTQRFVPPDPFGRD